MLERNQTWKHERCEMKKYVDKFRGIMRCRHTVRQSSPPNSPMAAGGLPLPLRISGAMGGDSCIETERCRWQLPQLPQLHMLC